MPGAGDVRCSLLCSSNEFGLTFVSCSKGVHQHITSCYVDSVALDCTCMYVYVNMHTFVHVHVGVQVFKTSILYEIDKDDSIGATNVIGEASRSHLVKFL